MFYVLRFTASLVPMLFLVSKNALDAINFAAAFFTGEAISNLQTLLVVFGFGA